MRRAFETAVACGWRITGVQPKFLSLSDITFVAPVEIGALVHFEAQESRGIVAEHIDAAALYIVKSSTPLIMQIDYGRGPPFQTYSVAVRCTMERPDMHPAFVDGKPRVASQLTNEFNFLFFCKDATKTPLVFPRTCKCDCRMSNSCFPEACVALVYCRIMQMPTQWGTFERIAARRATLCLKMLAKSRTSACAFLKCRSPQVSPSCLIVWTISTTNSMIHQHSHCTSS